MASPCIFTAHQTVKDLNIFHTLFQGYFFSNIQLYLLPVTSCILFQISFIVCNSALDISAINHNVYDTIGVQYSDICQSPFPISG